MENTENKVLKNVQTVVHKKLSPGAQQAISDHIADIEYKTIRTKIGQDRFQERELSWLQFNERVLELATDEKTPLLERLSFSAIFANNLDEFFMVRVAGLKRRIKTGLAQVGAAGISPAEVLRRVLERSYQLQNRHANLFSETLVPLLKKNDIYIYKWEELSDDAKEKLYTKFVNDIFPVLTPLAVDPAHPFPYISGGSLSLAIMVSNDKTGGKHFARVKVPSNISRFIEVENTNPSSSSPSSSSQKAYILLEDLIGQHLGDLFPGMTIEEVSTFRVTRNEDLEVEEDDAENLLQAMEKELLRRRFGHPIRLEVQNNMSDQIKEWITGELGVDKNEVFSLEAPLDQTGLFQLAAIDRPELHYPQFLPKTHRFISKKQSSKEADIFAAIDKGDILLHHPYDSFSTSVQRFLEQAAKDPDVFAIKQTLYRTSGNSPIIDALVLAATQGKQVLALVEIKARFDEEANIEWARKLEKAGVHVVYGIVGLKTHCKLSLVIKKNPSGEGMIHYSHVGTGNYNPKTARFYTDHGLLTRDEEVGEDLTKLFNQLSGYAPKSKYTRLSVAPRSIRKGILTQIENEISNAKEGKDAWIKFKINSIVDEETIEALYRASEAGVKVDLVVRGICALKAGVPKLSENIKVRSILGRFLEHSRIYAFANSGDPQVWIGSADLMHRNLDRRVETLVRIVCKEHIDELINLLEFSMSPKVQGWDLTPEGIYKRSAVDENNEPLIDLQAHIISTMKNKSGSLKLK